jgi:protein TonB
MDWLWSFLIAVGLNLVLFLLMPALINTRTTEPAFDSLVPQVQLIRLRQPDLPKPPEHIQPPEPQVAELPTPNTAQPSAPKLTLPFAINPRLPAGPSTLALPPLETGLATGLGDLFTTGQLDAPLTALAQIPPIYPLVAKRRNIEGWVTVRFVVDELGQVGRITVLAAEPEGIFEQNVLRCIAGWRFKPGTVGGTPVKSLVEQTITFKLE